MPRRAPVDPKVAAQYASECKAIDRAMAGHEKKLAALRDRRAVLWLAASDAGVSYDVLLEASGVSRGTVAAEVARARADLSGGD